MTNGIFCHNVGLSTGKSMHLDKYPKIEVERKTGGEPFHENGKPLDANLLSFWRWSASDLVGNAMRGILAEYIVASAIGVADGSRTEWDACDLRTKEGIRIEVKSGAYIQSWGQERLSNIQFNIRPTRGWDASTNTCATEAERQSDVYVFCLLNHQDQNTIDPLDISQWSFYVMATASLNESVGSQKTITLSSLKKLNPQEVAYGELHSAIRQAATKPR